MTTSKFLIIFITLACYPIFATATAKDLSKAGVSDTQQRRFLAMPAPPDPPADDRLRENALNGCANDYAKTVYLNDGDPYELGHGVAIACKTEIEAILTYRTRNSSEDLRKGLELHIKLDAHKLASLQIEFLRSGRQQPSRGL